MPVISGGNVNPPVTVGVSNPGIGQTIYIAQGVPTDANIGLPAASITNGMLAQDITNGNIYERAAGVWVRRDTL
jgi:hypothetical protein